MAVGRQPDLLVQSYTLSFQVSYLLAGSASRSLQSGSKISCYKGILRKLCEIWHMKPHHQLKLYRGSKTPGVVFERIRCYLTVCHMPRIIDSWAVVLYCQGKRV